MKLLLRAYAKYDDVSTKPPIPYNNNHFMNICVQYVMIEIPEIGIIFASNYVCVYALFCIWLFWVNNFQTMTISIKHSSFNWCYQHRFTLAWNNICSWQFSIHNQSKIAIRWNWNVQTFRLNYGTIDIFRFIQSTTTSYGSWGISSNIELPMGIPANVTLWKELLILAWSLMDGFLWGEE